ncbi:MAG: hypothetical protein SF162_20295 [bacterium]|nr:hypothetical protein [bacterium]
MGKIHVHVVIKIPKAHDHSGENGIMADAHNRQLEKLIQTIFDTHTDGAIDCDACEAQVCRLAELVAAGADLCELTAAVEAHMACCADCKEEWDALLAIVRAEQAGLLNS